MKMKKSDKKLKLRDYQEDALKKFAQEIQWEDLCVVRPNSCALFEVGELIEIKECTFKVVYIGKSNVLFEPVYNKVIEKEKLQDGPKKD
jgi:hypothetical protein